MSCTCPTCNDPVMQGLKPCRRNHVRPIVILESPYAGDTDRNVAYARAALRDCILRGEVPLASHLLYTQPGVLRDENQEERELGIALGLEMRRAADKTVVYTDLGLSSGMRQGIADAAKHSRPIEYRTLPDFHR